MTKYLEQIDDYLRYLKIIRGVAETTLRQKNAILHFFGRVTEISDLKNLTNEVFNKWVYYLSHSNVAPSSINIYNSIVISMIRYYLEIGLAIPFNTTLIAKMKVQNKARKFYSESDINSVVELASVEVGLMIRIMFETGMRIAEITRLHINNIDGRKITFIGKGRKTREVYITNKTLGLVRDYINKNRIEGYLWGIYDGILTCNGEPPTVNTVRKYLKQAFLRAGFDDFYPHALRHSFATDLQRRGASVAEIKEMMGHENIATTERYLHGFDGKLKELFDKYR